MGYRDDGSERSGVVFWEFRIELLIYFYEFFRVYDWGKR